MRSLFDISSSILGVSSQIRFAGFYAAQQDLPFGEVGGGLFRLTAVDQDSFYRAVVGGRAAYKELSRGGLRSVRDDCGGRAIINRVEQFWEFDVLNFGDS